MIYYQFPSDISRIPYSQPSWKFYFSVPDLASDHRVFHKFKMAITERNASKKCLFFLPVICCEGPHVRVISEAEATFDYVRSNG